MKFRRRRPVIEFLCAPEDLGVIAEPIPARTSLPTWLRKLPGIDPANLTVTNNGLTVKRCMPFFDAMATGWLVPLAATVRLKISDGGRTVDAGWEFDRELVSNHNAFQVAGNPYEPRPPMKFNNYWTIRTPKGWSCLFLPPANRPSDVFEILSGVVDTDTFVSPVNFPFIATGPDGVHNLAKGTELAQVIPFPRTAVALDGVVRAEAANEIADRDRIQRSLLTGGGWYRRNARASRTSESVSAVRGAAQ